MGPATMLRDEFAKLFKRPCHTIYRAPGRVNLIGEHTDYNDGYVMPAAIGYYTWVAAAPREDSKLFLHSTSYPGILEFDVDLAHEPTQHEWSDYLTGVAWVLHDSGLDVHGADLLIHGEVPIGAGLSSSAAIEVATGYALLSESGLAVDRTNLARLCQQAENQYTGTRCGIMDQFISCHGRAGHALLIDCRTLEFRPLPLPAAVWLVVCNTMVKHALSGGEYNQRREECEAGARALGVPALRDATLEQLEAARSKMTDVVYRRCRHVISENDRVLAAADALTRGDVTEFGKLMDASHASLRDDYEVSCRELDLMVELARGERGVYGARMTGGGFGGCAIAVVDEVQVPGFVSHVREEYSRVTGKNPDIFVCEASAGAQEVPVAN
ncbi:MAG: galactokinase [Candidatus Xenobia bacterium]